MSIKKLFLRDTTSPLGQVSAGKRARMALLPVGRQVHGPTMTRVAMGGGTQLGASVCLEMDDSDGLVDDGQSCWVEDAARGVGLLEAQGIWGSLRMEVDLAGEHPHRGRRARPWQSGREQQRWPRAPAHVPARPRAVCGGGGCGEASSDEGRKVRATQGGELRRGEGGAGGELR
jgi:hypothetical protein